MQAAIPRCSGLKLDRITSFLCAAKQTFSEATPIAHTQCSGYLLPRTLNISELVFDWIDFGNTWCEFLAAPHTSM